MFLLSCGRESVEARSLDKADAQRPSYETFRRKQASAKEQRRTRLKNEDIWSHSGSAEYDDEAPSAGATPPSTAAATADRTSVDTPDGAVAKVRPLNPPRSSAFECFDPALWALARPGRSKESSHGSSNPSSDEMAIPEHHVGVYQTFCQPQQWSPAFTSPGDFTIKMASVFTKDGELCFQIAVICACIKALRDGVRVKEVSKRKSYVKHIRRTQSELARFTESMTLRYVGHRLADKMPKHASLLPASRDQSTLDEYGEEVILFLSYLLTISEIGFNLLVTLTDPVVKHILVREFLDLSMGYGDQALLATSSCDARIERQELRPLLPSAWLDVDTGGTPDLAQSKSCYFHFSPRGSIEDPTSRSFSRFSDGNSEPPPSLLYRSQSDGFRPTTTIRSSASKCIQYVAPASFHDEKHADGAFTVEISGISIASGYAAYTISVLAYVFGSLETTSVDRRYSEFDALARTIESKVDSLRVRKHLPSKTLFRYLSASYLERRAASLQVFLEKLLRARFVGFLDQEIAIAAEPNVRQFLDLPSVEWSLVPWGRGSIGPGGGATAASHGRRSVDWRRQLHFPPSPAAVGDQTMDSTTIPTFTPSRLLNGYDLFDLEPARRQANGSAKRRSDSM
ncbi:hypothetical protein PybrP1_001031 [[Pythium] brassicae (nom. inval.)]|nr:hypothetical protein PybrP1_001031 [[Pythium] brassicae (nom. inval.)]